MPTFSTIQLPPPRDWNEFEDLCCDVWRLIWEDPNAQRNGRSGQSQAGVDIFGHPGQGLAVEGVQCKLRSAWLGQYLTKKDVEDAVAEAESFEPPLSHLTVATTSPRDARLQEEVRILSASRSQGGKFSISLQFWEDIYSRLAEQEDLLRKHYAQFLGVVRSQSADVATDSDLRSYLENFRLQVTQDLPALIPTRLLRNGATVQPEDLKKELAEQEVIHLHGPSGAGKSHLARHLAIELLKEGYVPLLVQAKYYSGDFDLLLDRSVSHLTTASATGIIFECERSGHSPFIIMDGFNECSAHLRTDLAQRLRAFQLRRPFRIVVTSRPEITCNAILEGSVIKLEALDQEERGRLASYYGDLPAGIAEVLRTPLDVRIAAESATRIGSGLLTQHVFFHAYARGRLPEEADRSFALLTKIAAKMADLLTSALPEPEIHRLLQVSPVVVPSAVLRSLSDSGLVMFTQGSCSFWHEKVQRFFQAEALLVRHLDHPGSLVMELSSARNEDALEFVIGALVDAPSIQACIPAIRSEELLLSMLCGELGLAAKVAIEGSVRQLLNKARYELTLLSIEKGEEPSYAFTALSVKSSITWLEHEYRLMGFLGRALATGFFWEEILDLLEKTEEECLRRVDALYPKKAWRYLFPYLYVGTMPSSLPVSRIIQAFQSSRLGSWPQEVARLLSARFEDLEHQSPGILLLLSFYLRGVFWYEKELNLETYLAPLLERMWSTRLYHLRLEAAHLAHSIAYRIEEPLRAEIEELLETFLGNNYALNGMVIEALAQYRDLGIASGEQARSEIRQVLDGPRDDEACEMAAALYGNIFEDPVSEHYFAAIQELQAKERTDFLIMAALGSKPHFFSLSAILRELVESGVVEAGSAFEKWSVLPRPEGFITDDLAGIFLLAHIGLAHTVEALPRRQAPSGHDEESWLLWGEIVFWLHKRGLAEASIRSSCEPLWRRFRGPLLHAAVDPLYQMDRYAKNHRLKENVYLPVSKVFREELRALFHEALPRVSEMTSLLGPLYREEDRVIYMIEELGEFGDEGSVLVLQPHVESEVLGRSAVKAIRAIRARAIVGMN